MKKEDLKSGVHSVVFRNGKSGYWDGEAFILYEETGLLAIFDYNDELECAKDKQWDIITIIERVLAWQREEKEMIEIGEYEFELDYVKKAFKDLGFTVCGEEPKEELNEEYSLEG